MDDFIHNLRMGKNRPYDRKRRNYDNSKYKGNTPQSARGKKGISNRKMATDNLAQVKKVLDEIVANQKRLIDIAQKKAAAAERNADALETIAAKLTDFVGRQQLPGTQPLTETAEALPPMTTPAAPSPSEPAVQRPDRSFIRGEIIAMRSAGKSYESIARHLNAEGVPTLSGRGKWRGQTVQRLSQQNGADQSP